MDPQYPLHVKGKKPEALSFGAVRSLSPRLQQMILIPGKGGGSIFTHAVWLGGIAPDFINHQNDIWLEYGQIIL